MSADGYSLDDRRQPLLDISKLGAKPQTNLSNDEHLKNNLPDIILRWKENKKSLNEKEQNKVLL